MSWLNQLGSLVPSCKVPPPTCFQLPPTCPPRALQLHPSLPPQLSPPLPNLFRPPSHQEPLKPWLILTHTPLHPKKKEKRRMSALRLPARRLLANPTAAAGIRTFRTSAPTFVRVGDAIPSIPLLENSPGNHVNLAEELKGTKGLIIGVPAAFSGTCQQSHVPSYMNHPKLKDAGKVFVVSVNDPFV